MSPYFPNMTKNACAAGSVNQFISEGHKPMTTIARARIELIPCKRRVRPIRLLRTSLTGRPPMTREQWRAFSLNHQDQDPRIVEFLSLQDLKGSQYFGGAYDKIGHVAQFDWDLLVIDEAHEGIDTTKTDVAFDRIKRKWTLHLSGTPFKALASGKFEQVQIFNWTYEDEQVARHEPPPVRALARQGAGQDRAVEVRLDHSQQQRDG